MQFMSYYGAKLVVHFEIFSQFFVFFGGEKNK